MFAASASSYKGQSAVALGYSRVSDNGKITLRLQGTAVQPAMSAVRLVWGINGRVLNASKTHRTC